MGQTIDFKKRPWLKILIHSDSIVDISEISNFLELNLTEYVEIDVTPTVDTKLIAIFTQNNIDVPRYSIDNGNIAMCYERGFSNAQSYSTRFERILSKSESVVTNEDLLMSERYNYFVVGESDPLHQEKPIANLAAICDVKKILQIVFSNKGIFLHRPNQSIDEGWYYMVRATKVFRCCKELWSISVHLKHRYPDINRTIGSLWKRFDFILRAYEKVAFHALGLDDADSHSHVLYHLGFFVMLCTGAFDEIAWIANYLYDLKLDRREIDLRYKTFRKSLRQNNSMLADLISERRIQKMIESFYPIRDSLQHRNYLSSYTLQSGAETSQMIYLDRESSACLEAYVELEEIQHRIPDGSNSEYSVHPTKLIKYLIESFTHIITNYFEHLDWEKLKAELEADDRIILEETMEEFERDIDQYLLLGGKGMYF